MITFKAIIIPGNRRKDGTYPVNIRVTFKGKSRRLATTLVCTPGDLTRSLKIKNPTILTRSDELIARMRDAVKDLSPFDLESQDVDWVVMRIRDSLTRQTFHLDFFEWADKFILTKNHTTRKAYECAVNAFARFLGRRSIDINEISRPMILEFQEKVDGGKRCYYSRKTHRVEVSKVDKIPQGSATIYLSKLEHIHNAAKERYNDEDEGRIFIPRSPFARIPKVHPISRGQGNLGRDLMQRIISAQVDDPAVRTALDVFVVSFTLMGANMADLYDAKPVNDVWIYNRQKTRERRIDQAEMRVTIPSRIRPYLDRLQGEGDRWLNVLRSYSSTKDNATARVNRNLRKWCEDNKVDVFTLYSARHTWASLCRNDCRVDKATIDDCLGHKGSFQVTDIYAERAWDLMQDANTKVLDLFTWD